LEICHASRDNSGSVSCVTELEVSTYHTFQLLLQLIRLTTDVRIIGGGLRFFTEAASSCGVFGVSVYIPVVLSGAKIYGWRPP
jgi:hypothetical protein